MPDVLYTIGHSTHSMEKLINLLTAHHITAVADVRSHPYSRFNPQFNRENLHAALKTAGISYVFLGRELGARPEARTCYVDGTVQYDCLARTDLFQEGLRRIVEGMMKYRIALLCAEKDPLACHRTILICRHLVAQGIAVKHILEDSQLESHDEALARLLKELGLPEGDLFQSRDDFIIEAYNRRGQQIAYTEKERSPEEQPREVQ
ncbi:MAG: DUF488 domain-containing protein [Anaerolineales bacterium]|nr:DUF488 domain-containing protein [Anaerolineales bacterium]